MATILEYAQLSAAIYGDVAAPGDWTVMDFHDGLGVGLQAAYYKKNDSHVVAFKGTSLPQASDLVADLKIGTGINTSYFSAAERYVQRFADVPGLVVTGHSLGGAVAQTVGNRRRSAFVTFNAPGVAILASRNIHTTMPHMMGVRLAGGILSAFRHPLQAVRDVRSAFHDSLGVNFRLTGDVVSRIGLHYGPIVTVQGAGLNQHPIGLVVERLRLYRYGDIPFPG